MGLQIGGYYFLFETQSKCKRDLKQDYLKLFLLQADKKLDYTVCSTRNERTSAIRALASAYRFIEAERIASVEKSDEVNGFMLGKGVLFGQGNRPKGIPQGKTR